MSQTKQERFLAELLIAEKATDATEVAVAFRAATAILFSVNMTWAKFVESRKPVDSSTGNQNGAAGSEDAGTVRSLLEKAMRNTDPQSSFYTFLQSLSDQFEEKGYLSDKQMSALRRSAVRS